MTKRRQVQMALDGMTSLVTAVAALAVLWNVAWPRTAPPTSQRQSRTPTVTVDGIETDLGGASRIQNAAKLAIIEFSDFECPYCGRYARETYPRIQTELVDKGIVTYSFRHFPLEAIHKAALKAGEASVCAGDQGKFWEMHDRLFQNQQKLAETDLLVHARAIGLDSARFLSCLDKRMLATIRADQEEAKKFGVNSTPTFLFGIVGPTGKIKVVRKLSGAQPFEIFESIVDEVLKGT